MNSTNLLKELDRLRSLKNKEREAALGELLQDDFARDVCRAALDPFVRYHINKRFDVESGSATWSGAFDNHGVNVWRLLSDLSDRIISGQSAIRSIEATVEVLDPYSQELLWRVLTKDLRCGAGPKTFNKVVPGFVPLFEMQTCHAYDPKRVTQWPVVCEIKYDGTRVACVWEDSTLTIVSRNGLPMPGFEPFARDMQARMRALQECGVDLPDMILDGEMDSVEGFYETVGGARRKDGQGEFVLRLFDAVPLAPFKAGSSNVSWGQRCDVARRLAQVLNTSTITFTPGIECHTDEQVRHVYEHARSKDHEGIIVKQPDAPYECKRGYHWMKIKSRATVDIPVIGCEEGTGKYVGMLGAVICDLEGKEVRVGTGFSDKERQSLWLDHTQAGSIVETTSWEEELDCYVPSEYERRPVVGRMLEVEYAEKTPDGSLRHPRAVRWRGDKHIEDGPGV